MKTTQTTEITIRQTGSPSRSKMAGPCWIAIGDVYAAAVARTIPAEIGDEIEVTGKATLRRATRTSTDRGAWTVVVTGDDADKVSLSLGSPQAVEAEITGVRAK